MEPVPDGTVQEVLDWVGDDPARAEQALEAERLGAGRSTLITRLEAIASPTQEDTAMTETETVEETEELAGPEQPKEILIEEEDVTWSAPPAARDADVEVGEQELIPSDAIQVELLAAAGAPQGFILVLNGSDAYAFTPQMTATLKTVVDRAVSGVVL